MTGLGIDHDIPLKFASLEGFDMHNPNDVDKLQSLIEKTHAKVIIIDSLADIMSGKDENSVKDVQPVFLALRKISEKTQSAIIVIHHKNKNGGYRGSSAIKGAVDLLLTVKKSGSNGIEFNIEKTRDTEPYKFGA